MSTLRATNLKHASSGSNNVVLDSSGHASITNDLKFNSGYGSAATAYGVRAWVNFNGTGTVAIRDSGNVSSITDHGSGDYSINYSTSMPDNEYATLGTAGGFDAGTPDGNRSICPQIQNVNYIRTNAQRQSDGSNQDVYSISVAIVR